MRRNAAAAALVSAVAAGLAAPATSERCAPALSLRAYPDGAELARLALGASGFTLSYRHSVTLTAVESRYSVEDGQIIHVAEAFADHGPGLSANAAAPGARWEKRDGRFVLSERRPVGRLVVRVQREYGNRLDAGDLVDLTRWGDRAIEIVVLACNASR